MRAIVCGGRNYSDRNRVYETLDRLVRERGLTTVIEGGAGGADQLARGWAFTRGFSVQTFHAKWSEHGRAAGPLRNAQMLSEASPDFVVAFPGGPGTANMVRQARAAGVEVMRVD